jgi:N-acetylmuramoyl-L-alanine amidase
MPTDPPSPRRRLLLAAAAGCFLPGCSKKPVPAPAPAGRLITPGAAVPDWSRLDPWQGRVTREDFVHLLTDVLTGDMLWSRHIEMSDDAALIRRQTPAEESAVSGEHYLLKFAPSGSTDTAPALRYWRRMDELPPLRDPARPLEGIHIALDPGHIGGSWAVMEERYSKPAGASTVVKEGEITLRTAQILAPMLEARGARVSLVRSRLEPATSLRPEQLLKEARASLVLEGRAAGAQEVKKEAERLFYRAYEVRARGVLVNETIRPDLVLCIHYNGNVASGRLSKDNHLHVLAHGCIGDNEFRFDDQRLEGLLRLVQRIPEVELPLCTALARSMADATGLPPFTYTGSNARAVAGQPYVWMRNLIANRVYLCPVAYIEPYVMNNAEVIDRLAAGDYEGTADVGGKNRISIFREYAGGLTAGLSEFFLQRPRA